MPRPDILLVKPGSQKLLYGALNNFNLTAIEPPLWASLLAGHLRGLGFAVELRDAEVEDWSHEETAQHIKDINPLLVVFSVSGTNPSASTMNMTGAANSVRHLKQIAPEIKTLFHGLHPASLPERTMREEPADFVCQGEGFSTLPELIRTLKSAEPNFSIQGLWYREGDQIRSNPPAPLFKNLDDLPMPAWDLLPMDRYRAHNWHCFEDLGSRQPYGIVYTSLGCPFKCSFCCINSIFGKAGIRYRSPQKVVEEIDFLVQNYGIRHIKIIDELFAMNERRVLEICDLIIERGYDLNMWAYARVDTVTPAMLQRMKAAGINWIAYGFESGNKKALEGVDKSYDLCSVNELVRMTYDEGLYIGANFIFGLPDDDFDTMQETLSMALDINAEWANFYSTMAYPGSPLYDQAIEQGLSLPETWDGYSQYSEGSHPMATKYLSSGEVTSFRDFAFHTYFENPRYLDKIKRRFGLDTVRHIQDMTRHRLKRHHTQF